MSCNFGVDFLKCRCQQPSGEVGEFSAGIGYIGAIDHLPKARAVMELLYMSWVRVRSW